MTKRDDGLDGWLDTLRSKLIVSETLPEQTIVPAHEQGEQAKALLAQVIASGRAVELRTGRVIGEGGMGVVREAEQVALGRMVAVKTVKAGRAAGAADELLREAWVTGALEHPNIVPIHHLGTDDAGLPVLILKRIDGVEWSTLLGDPAEIRSRFGTTDVLARNVEILHQVMNALRFAHSRGFVHRDLKPSNVMIGSFGEVYLLDWGIAVSLREDDTGRFPRLGSTWELAGTPCYMAPEMLGRDGTPISERTDVYLAGAVLFELLAGRPPHTGSDVYATIASIVSSTPALPADAPGELAQICMRAMDSDPNKRFDSIDAMQLALQHYLEHRGSAQLAARAGEQVDALLAAVKTAGDGDREELYRQLAICRFGFHEALAVWRDNAEARSGLMRATCAVAEFELAHDQPSAALRLLNELSEPPALVLERAQAAEAAAITRRHALEHIREDLDPLKNSRVRWITGIVLGGFFWLAPLVRAMFSGNAIETHADQVIWAGVFLVVVTAAAGWRARGPVPMTSVDRKTFMTVGFMFVAQGALALGGWALGLQASIVQVLMIFLWFVVASTAAIMVDRYLAFAAIGYLIGFVLGATHLELRLYAISTANLGFALNIAWRWRPAQRRLAELERDQSGRS